MKKIAIFNWGEISIHTYYLLDQLRNEGFVIDLFLYTPLYAYKRSYLLNLMEEVREKANVIEIKGSPYEAKVIRINRIASFLQRQSASICINPFLPGRTRPKFRASEFEFIVTVKQSSLYWLYKTDRSCLKKTIHFSLEVEKISDPFISPHSCHYKLIKKEEIILKETLALMVQDKDRAEALLNTPEEESHLRLVYFPVSIPGNAILEKSNYLFRKLNIAAEKKIILYYGSVFKERKLEELIEAGEHLSGDDFVLVLHGEDDFSDLIKDKEKVKSSNEIVNFDDIYKIISSATIGIAFYDTGWANTRLTAFSSEKIARYLQAGVPFIAFKNENYLKLQNEFKCVELIDEFVELKGAVDKIMANYPAYRKACFEAYEKYYNIRNTIKPLLNFLNPASFQQHS